MSNWFHKFFNPHCPDCKADREESKICDSCETLKLEIARLRIENERLIDRIITPPIENQHPINIEELKPIKPPSTHLAWRVRKQMLEQESRAQAKLEQEQKLNDSKSTEELEKELGINNEETK